MKPLPKFVFDNAGARDLLRRYGLTGDVPDLIWRPPPAPPAPGSVRAPGASPRAGCPGAAGARRVGLTWGEHMSRRVLAGWLLGVGVASASTPIDLAGPIDPWSTSTQPSAAPAPQGGLFPVTIVVTGVAEPEAGWIRSQQSAIQDRVRQNIGRFLGVGTGELVVEVGYGADGMTLAMIERGYSPLNHSDRMGTGRDGVTLSLRRSYFLASELIVVRATLAAAAGREHGDVVAALSRLEVVSARFERPDAKRSLVVGYWLGGEAGVTPTGFVQVLSPTGTVTAPLPLEPPIGLDGKPTAAAAVFDFMLWPRG